MEAEFWHERWREGRIGFHEGETNALLRAHWHHLAASSQPNSEVFVPLCGKSLDMVWLASEKPADGTPHQVIGVELSDLAVRAFFIERGLEQADSSSNTTFTVETSGDFDIYRHGRFEIWCGDFFAFPKTRLERTNLAYDRASLIALPPDMRRSYARKLSEILPADARTLLLTLTYGEGELQGPPFSVTDQEVRQLFGRDRSVSFVERRDALAGSQNLKERGAQTATTSVFVIGPATP